MELLAQQMHSRVHTLPMCCGVCIVQAMMPCRSVPLLGWTDTSLAEHTVHRPTDLLVPTLGMMHSPGFDGSSSLSFQMLMNADSLYTAAHCALLLNLKLLHGDYYRKRPALAPGMMVGAHSA